MGIIIDLIIIAIILLSTFLAYRKGLIKLSIQLCSFLIAIILTVILYQPISNLIINTTGIDEALENTIYEKVNEIVQEGENEYTSEIIETAKNGMLPEAARELSINIVRGLVLIVLFIAIRIILKFVTVIADFIAKIPVIDQLNKVGGLVYGILRGILIIYIVLLLINVIGQINPKNTIHQNIEQSFIGKTMYENNILNILF